VLKWALLASPLLFSASNSLRLCFDILTNAHAF
jgi:hypothetical protein